MRRNFKYKSVSKNVATSAYEDNKFEAPTKENVSDRSETLQSKSFRDLANIGTIDVRMDPNTEMSYGSFPYTIIGRTNKVVDASYPGDDNISGNTIVMMQNDTTSSQLMNLFDVACVVKKINYLYLPIRSGAVNTAVAGEMIKSIEQAVSFGWSTMLTSLPFMTATYASTDLPVPFSAPLPKAVGYYQALIHYQCVLQSLVQPISKYIELRSLERELMRMSFRTEAPLITQLMGLFKKSSFISEINTIGTVVINEYFDVNWYKQINTLTCVPSRKTKGMVDPLLTLIGVHAIPNLTINTTQYDSANLATGVASKLVNPETLELVTGSKTLEQLITDICKLMNPAYILKFVRLMNNNGLTIDTNHVHTISAYGEQVKTHLSYIANLAASFSTAMSDVRTFLDKLAQSNMVYWRKGVSFFVDKITQLEPTFNVLLNDVFKAEYSGADTISYDDTTKRWRAWAFWNKYEGIPEYDRVSGGSFLTFGLRNIASTYTDEGGNSHSIDFSTSIGLIPVLFDNSNGNTSSLAVTRKGAYSAINAYTISNNDLKTNHYLTRLNALNAANISLKMPYLTVTLSDATKRAKLSSSMLQFLSTVFGYGTVKYNSNYIDFVVDPDYIAFVDLEIQDVSNQMIVYSRNYSPCRIDTPNENRTIGFRGHQ